MMKFSRRMNLIAGLLANEHDASVLRAFTGYTLGRLPADGAGAAALNAGVKRLPGVSAERLLAQGALVV